MNVPPLIWNQLWILLVFKLMRRTWKFVTSDIEPLERMTRANIREHGLQVMWESHKISLDLNFPDIHLIWWIVWHHSSRGSAVIGPPTPVRVKIAEDIAYSIVDNLLKMSPPVSHCGRNHFEHYRHGSDLYYSCGQLGHIMRFTPVKMWVAWYRQWD